MQWDFSCPKCRTTFTAQGPDSVANVPCPTCGILLPVPTQARGHDQRARYASAPPPLTIEPPAASRRMNWIMWIAGAFAALWVVVIALMLLLVRRPGPAPVAASPSPPAVVSNPAPSKPPLFDVNVSPVPTTQTQTASATLVPAPPPKPPAPELRIVPKAAAVTDDDVTDAIRKGIDFLLSNFDGPGLKAKLSGEPSELDGMDALCVYALLHCSQSTRDERITPGSPEMRKMLAHLKSLPMTANTGSRSPITYSRSLRAAALALYDRPEDCSTLGADVQWLMNAACDGAYTYDDVFLRPGATVDPNAPQRPGVHQAFTFNYDNSNSQYGLLGVWSGADAGIQIPTRYWKAVATHWATVQHSDGTWGYSYAINAPSYSMTVAGIAALSVTRDYLDLAGEIGGPERTTAAEALDKAIEWLDTGDNAVNVAGQSYGYSLYGLERAALASGILYPGRHDLYRELVTQVIPRQHPNGSFGDPDPRNAVIETAFHLLFLARGRNPVMMNKLRYAGGLWDRHPRDLANLTRYASEAMERPVNWQVVSLNQPWSTWLDAPILYIAGRDPPSFKPSYYDKLRQYENNGGLIFTHADGGSESFNAFAEDLARTLFPDYETTSITGDDDLFSLQFVINESQPKMRAVSNGARRLMIHSSTDIATLWEHRDRRKRSPTTAPADVAMQMGINLFVYATGKGDLRSRLDSPYIPPPSTSTVKTVPIARLQYAGNWDPEPAAWDRFERYFWWETGWDAQPRRVEISQLHFRDFPFAHLTGTTPDMPTEPQMKALRDFVNEGGVLLIDACGGSRRFNETIRKNWLPAIFTDGVPRVMSDDDPIITGKVAAQLTKAADDLSKVAVRRYTAQVAKPSNTRLLEFSYGKGRVIISELDLSTGLLGTEAWGISGYAPGYAQSLVKNILLWAASR